MNATRSSARRWDLHSPSTWPVRTSKATSSAHVPLATVAHAVQNTWTGLWRVARGSKGVRG